LLDPQWHLTTPIWQSFAAALQEQGKQLFSVLVPVPVLVQRLVP
jgi:hypothetical protein